MKRDVIRIIDANFNRSREGLRVCEEVARFVLNSASLTKELKDIRHRISEIIKLAPLRDIKALSLARDVEGDVGKASKLKAELKRLDVADIFLANIERVKESLRVLEEFFKLIDVGAAAKFSRLRFRVYEIEKRAYKRVSSLRDIG